MTEWRRSFTDNKYHLVDEKKNARCHGLRCLGDVAENPKVAERCPLCEATLVGS